MNATHANIAETSTNNEASTTALERYKVISSLNSKLPSTLVIKSANLRVLDPIGQGLSCIRLYISLQKHEKASMATRQGFLIIANNLLYIDR